MDKDKELPRNRESDTRLVENAEVSDVAFAQRRKLIRASAAAVPAIMTLRSGVAAANSLHGCIEQDAQKAIATGPLDNVLGDAADDAPHDEWLRVTGKAGRWIQGSGSNNYFSIRTKEASAVPWDDRSGWSFYDKHGNLLNNSNPISDAAWQAATNFYCVDQGGSWDCVQEGGAGLMPTVPVLGTEISKGINVYLLVYVQAVGGQILDAVYYPSTLDQMGTNITTSCWCSVNPTNNLLGLG